MPLSSNVVQFSVSIILWIDIQLVIYIPFMRYLIANLDLISQERSHISQESSAKHQSIAETDSPFPGHRETGFPADSHP